MKCISSRILFWLILFFLNFFILEPLLVRKIDKEQDLTPCGKKKSRQAEEIDQYLNTLTQFMNIKQKLIFVLSNSSYIKRCVHRRNQTCFFASIPFPRVLNQNSKKPPQWTPKQNSFILEPVPWTSNRNMTSSKINGYCYIGMRQTADRTFKVEKDRMTSDLKSLKACGHENGLGVKKTRR